MPGLSAPVSLTPICNKQLLLPEELPILLAFFHMSNVVRYNPEFLVRLEDSPEWGLLHVFSRQGIYRYLVLFWSFFNQRTYLVT